MQQLEQLDSVICLLERRVEELRADDSDCGTPCTGTLPHQSGNFAHAREAIVRLYEEAMEAARFDLQVLRG